MDFITIIDWQLDRGTDGESSQYTLLTETAHHGRADPVGTAGDAGDLVA